LNPWWFILIFIDKVFIFIGKIHALEYRRDTLQLPSAKLFKTVNSQQFPPPSPQKVSIIPLINFLGLQTKLFQTEY